MNIESTNVYSEIGDNIKYDVKDIAKNLNLAAKYFVYSQKQKAKQSFSKITTIAKAIKDSLNNATNEIEAYELSPEEQLKIQDRFNRNIPIATMVSQANQFQMSPDTFYDLIAKTAEKENKVFPLLQSVAEDQKSYLPTVTDENCKFSDGLPYDPIRSYIDELARDYSNQFLAPSPNLLNLPFFSSMQEEISGNKNFKLTYKDNNSLLKIKNKNQNLSIVFKQKGDRIGKLMMTTLANSLEEWINQQRGFMWLFAKELRNRLRNRVRGYTEKINIQETQPKQLNEKFYAHQVQPTNRNCNIYENYVKHQQEFIKNLYRYDVSKSLTNQKKGNIIEGSIVKPKSLSSTKMLQKPQMKQLSLEM